MKQYLMTFTPKEPYFFGNEKSFLYPGQENVGQLSNQYFIRSENTPSQTTVLGMLRYMLLAVRKSDFGAYTKDDKIKNSEAVGPESFDYERKEQQFGKIKQISPVFLINDKQIFVKTPFDHIVGQSFYTPFSDYRTVKTPEGNRLYTPQYDSKIGITKSYMRLSDGKIFEADEIFFSDIRVGINCGDFEGYFKREYKMLVKGFSFAVYVTLDYEVLPKNQAVFLGQGKSVFYVDFKEEQDNLSEEVKKHLGNTVYCLSDSFVSNEIYKNTLFGITKTRDYRAYTTNYGRVKKGSLLYRILQAGSVFKVENIQAFSEGFEDKHAQQIGFNRLI